MKTDATFELEQTLLDAGALWVAGVDEVGRGAWAGPLLVAAAVITKDDISSAPEGLCDSKMISAAKREKLDTEIRAWIPIGLGWVSEKEIDEIGMAASLRLGAKRALEQLGLQGEGHIIQDGSSSFLPGGTTSTVRPKADATCAVVAAASIAAKVARDKVMKTEGAKYPQHPALASSSGYGTRAHTESLQEYGLTPMHRASFKIPGKDQALKPATIAG